jgi:ribosomal protein S12 methylthiotransferase accessory factor
MYCRMQTIEYPLAFGHWHVRKDRLVCRMPRRTVDVAAPGELLGAVLELCTGQLAWKEVAARLATRWSADSVEGFLGSLSSEGVLVEAGEALAGWREIGEFPALFPRLASPEEAHRLPAMAQSRLLPGTGVAARATPQSQALSDLLQARQSHRTFADVPLTTEDLASVVWAAHGVTRSSPDVGVHRTIASGGNIHSARWFVAVLRALPTADAAGRSTSPGLYEARFHLQGGVSLLPMEAPIDDVWCTMLDPRPLRFASAVLLPIRDVSVPARKYGNRATVFAYLETGQSLQNAQLMAAAVGAACVVRGDTCASAVLDLVARNCTEPPVHRSHWLPMPCLVIGAQPTADEATAVRQGNWIKIGPIGPDAGGAREASAPRRFGFSAGPVPVGDAQLYASGRAADPRLAITKAEAEAWERRGWAQLGAATEGRMSEVDGALDPGLVVAYTAAQSAAAGFPCVPFSRRRKYLWVSGVDAESGASVRLPADCIHALTSLPAAFRRKALTNSNTSGVAAWTEEEGALCRATLELVERHEFLRCWIGGQAPARIPKAGLPGAARARVEALESAGFAVSIGELASGFASVVSVFVQKQHPPFTAITAAADFDVECALHKALDEAEGRATHAMHFPAEPLRRLREVASLQDINRLYQSPAHFRRADFYAAGPLASVLGATGAACSNWNELRSALAAAGHRLLSFDLTPDGASVHQGRVALRVVRAFATGLLPIWFHQALAPAGLAAFAAAAAVQAGRRASSARFLHPFT